MKKLFNVFLCMAFVLLLMPAKAVNASEMESSVSVEDTLVVIEDEETPLYSGEANTDTFNAYRVMVVAGAVMIFGTVFFIQKKRN